jgi:hypothetical protein
MLLASVSNTKVLFSGNYVEFYKVTSDAETIDFIGATEKNTKRFRRIFKICGKICGINGVLISGKFAQFFHLLNT